MDREAILRELEHIQTWSGYMARLCKNNVMSVLPKVFTNELEGHVVELAKLVGAGHSGKTK